jgi:DNA-directed RNA polymerase subunit H (RpoH/RPB5)
MDRSTLVTQVYKARITLLTQLSEQGYDVSKLTGISITEVGTMLKHDQLDFNVTRDDGRNVYVKFHHTKALRPANVYDFVDQLFKSDDPILAPTDSLYIVANSDANDTLTKVLGLLWQQEKLYVVVNSLAKLQYNALEHTLVPKHYVLTDDEAAEVRRKYSIRKDSQLPAISRFDPIAVIIGLRPGQICQVVRPSRTSINSINYRFCEG